MKDFCLKTIIKEELKDKTRTIVLYEAPHHIVNTLELLEDYVGKDRKIVIVKELTKKHESRMIFTIKSAIEFFSVNKPLGEYILIIDGLSLSQKKENDYSKWNNINILDHMKIYENENKKEAMKKVAHDRGITKREVYNILNKKGEE